MDIYISTANILKHINHKKLIRYLSHYY